MCGKTPSPVHGAGSAGWKRARKEKRSSYDSLHDQLDTVGFGFRTGMLQRIRNKELLHKSNGLIGSKRQWLVPDSWQQMSWRDCLLERGFFNKDDFAATRPDAQTTATIFLSNHLTYPITVANAWKNLSIDSKKPKLCLVGADMETDNMGLWQELSFLTQKDMYLEFIGPEVEDKEEEVGKSHAFEIRGKNICGTLQDVWRDTNPEDCHPDAFLVFLPGAGTNPNYTWSEAFDIMKETDRPILLTAYNESDAQRDSEWLKFKVGIYPPPQYEANPWAIRPASVSE